MVSRQHYCRITVKDKTSEGNRVQPRDKRLLVLCRKPEDSICAGYSAIPDPSANRACLTRIVNHLRTRVAGGAVDEIAIISSSKTRLYTHNQTQMINEISEIVNKIGLELDELSRSISSCRCQSHKACPKKRRVIANETFGEEDLSGDPIGSYIGILGEKRSWERMKRLRLPCWKTYFNFLESAKRHLLKSTLISKFLEQKSGYSENERETVYGHFFQPIIVPRIRSSEKAQSVKGFTPAEEYEVGPFTVTISVDQNRCENLYTVCSLIDKDDSLRTIVGEITAEIRDTPNITSSHTFLSLSELMRTREREALKLIRERYPELAGDVSSSIAELCCYMSIGIESIAPFLIDEQVEEFFIDQPGSSVYLDHRVRGRCRTSITLSASELKRIETRVRAESGFRLDRLNPSIKTEIATKKFTVRASIDISPLAADGFHLDIRKLDMKRLSLISLIRNGTLSSEAAAYLYFCILRKTNIVAVGEPGSGKTTIANALDLLTPPNWRKITIEDAIESIPQRDLGKHQVRLRVEPFEEAKGLRSKGREIISLLHRTPDVIYLGEIQTASHSRAMFHALSAGLTGLQTCHAGSVEQAILRWVIHHKIPPICLNQIGIIIHMKKVGIGLESIERRKVVRICEVKKDEQTTGMIDFSSNSVQLLDIFRWDPSSDELGSRTDLFETPSLNAIKEFEVLSKSAFENEISRYRSLFETLANRSEIDIDLTTKIFDEIYKDNVTLRNERRDSLVSPQHGLRSQSNSL